MNVYAFIYYRIKHYFFTLNKVQRTLHVRELSMHKLGRCSHKQTERLLCKVCEGVDRVYTLIMSENIAFNPYNPTNKGFN